MREFSVKAIFFGLFLTTMGARANSIEWGSEVFGVGLTSTGVPLDNTFHFELGTFNGLSSSFIPDETNIPLWRSNWKLLDSTNYNTTTRIFTDTAVLVYNNGTSNWSPSVADVPAPSATFEVGEQVYIWIYNNTAMDSTTEWGVFTRTASLDPKLPNWVMPGGPGNQEIQPQQMFTLDTNATPFGGTPTTTGGGSYNPPTSTFSFQTHSFVPEPTSALLLVVAGMGCFARRRK
jgi:hypothetical protein